MLVYTIINKWGQLTILSPYWNRLYTPKNFVWNVVCNSIYVIVLNLMYWFTLTSLKIPTTCLILQYYYSFCGISFLNCKLDGRLLLFIGVAGLNCKLTSQTRKVSLLQFGQYINRLTCRLTRPLHTSRAIFPS